MSHSTRHKRRRSRSNDRFDTQMIANGVLLILFALLAGIASYTMYAHNILAFRHVNVIYTAVLVVVFLVCLLLTLFKKGKTPGNCFARSFFDCRWCFLIRL